ncbi:tetratricopeptide repeat protein [Bradyrhizobium lablabi]|uniref:tetratricopeptide repeat protein n=1 Tax=Bradyrhizobium lablabi TaxID=722472 RepID=UPI0032DE798F
MILTFSGDFKAAWRPVDAAIKSLTRGLDRPISEIRAGSGKSFTTATSGPGHEVIDGLKPPTIPVAIIEKMPAATAAVLKDARSKLLAGRPSDALDVLQTAAETDPAIAYAKAVATLNYPSKDQAITAQRLLRQATQKAFAPAFTLNGLVLYRLLALDERGELPYSDRVTLDGSGRTVNVTNTQLASEAMLWWQRGAAFHDPEAMRLLGMGEARGFNGKPNLSAAIAYWHDAARRGDALAQLELAHLYYQGAGVEADSEKAIALFRQAADQGLSRAALGLGAVLTGKGITGDLDATRDALRVLDTVARTSTSKEERALSQLVLGRLLSEAAPPALRDPARGLEHFRMALRLGNRSARAPLCRAYETGVGAPQDLVRAANCFMAMGGADISKDVARVVQNLNEADLARAKALQTSEDPPPEFLAEYTPRTSAPTLRLTRPSETVKP